MRALPFWDALQERAGICLHCLLRRFVPCPRQSFKPDLIGKNKQTWEYEICVRDTYIYMIIYVYIYTQDFTTLRDCIIFIHLFIFIRLLMISDDFWCSVSWLHPPDPLGRHAAANTGACISLSPSETGFLGPERSRKINEARESVSDYLFMNHESCSQALFWFLFFFFESSSSFWHASIYCTVRYLTKEKVDRLDRQWTLGLKELID
jgi:hypothetical protein